jgi:hypothetical protein
METNPVLKEMILEIVANQLKTNDPPETKLTLDRLIAEGHSEKEAKRLIGCAATAEIFYVMKSQKASDHQRYIKALKALPTLPE